jgi:hypothetical protein
MTVVLTLHIGPVSMLPKLSGSCNASSVWSFIFMRDKYELKSLLVAGLASKKRKD